MHNAFSDTFVTGIGVSRSAFAMLMFVMPVVYLILNAIFWNVSKIVQPTLDAKTRAAALFCSSQKTLAFGIFFIKATFSSRSDLAYILAPLLIYSPAQLLLGSTLLVPVMMKLIKEQESSCDGDGN